MSAGVSSSFSRLRTLSRVLADGNSVGGLDARQFGDLEAKITRAIVEELSSASANEATYDGFAAWALRQNRALPLEVFTLNYDLLVEQAFEKFGVEYTDGFIGSLRAPFKAQIVDDAVGSASGLPPSFARLWKLHGSVNWTWQTVGTARTVVRTGGTARPGDVAAIYPSEDKYAEARRVPFLVLHDRFRRSLAMPETLMLVSGYSFGDDHVNEVIFEAASRSRRSAFFVFCFSEIPTVLVERASTTPSLVVASAEEGIISGRRVRWRTDGDTVGVVEGGKFRLGDFKELSMFLGSMLAQDEPR